MTIKEARKIVEEYADNTKKVTEEDFFMFAEAMDFLINEEHKAIRGNNLKRSRSKNDFSCG